MNQITPNQRQLLDALRTLLAYGAGIAVAHGWLSENTITQIGGAVTVFVPLIWGMWSHRTATAPT